MPVGQMPVSLMPVGQIPVGQMPVDQMPVGQMPVGQMLFEQRSWNRAWNNAEKLKGMTFNEDKERASVKKCVLGQRNQQQQRHYAT